MNTTTAVQDPEPTSPLAIDHGDTRTVDQGQTVTDGPSELEQHKRARGYVKPPAKNDPEPPPLPEAAAEEPKGEEKKKADRWTDPDTNDVYDMRHKVARRVKTLLEDRGKSRAETATERARAESAERRVEELTRLLIARGETPAKAETKAQAVVDGDPEPDPADTAKYPEGQFDRAFIRDQARWAARQETNARFQTEHASAQQHRQQAQEQRAVEAWQQTLPEARKRYADFDDVLARIPNTPENAPIVRLMMGSPVGNDVVYVLGTQEAAMEAYRRAPSAEDRARLLYHIEAQLIQAHRAASAKAQTSQTQAPAPTSPLNTAGGASQAADWSRNDDPDQLSRWKSMRKR